MSNTRKKRSPEVLLEETTMGPPLRKMLFKVVGSNQDIHFASRHVSSDCYFGKMSLAWCASTTLIRLWATSFLHPFIHPTFQLRSQQTMASGSK